jgi:hypothetical protein
MKTLTPPEVRQAKEEIRDAGIQLLRFAEKKGILTTAQFKVANLLRWFENPTKDMARAVERELSWQKVEEPFYQNQVEEFRKQIVKAIQDRGIPIHSMYIADAAKTEIACRIREYDFRGIYVHRTPAQMALMEHHRQLICVDRTPKQERLYNELADQISREVYGEEPREKITPEKREFLKKALKKRLSEMKKTARPPEPQPWGKAFA